MPIDIMVRSTQEWVSFRFEVGLYYYYAGGLAIDVPFYYHSAEIGA